MSLMIPHAYRIKSSVKLLFMMKSLTILVLLAGLNLVFSHKKPKATSLVPYAISGILSEYFANHSSRVDLIQYGKISAESEKLFENILRTKSDSTVLQ